MMAGMFRDALSWVAGLIEAVGVVAAILLVGLVVGMTGFWILVHSLSKLAGQPAESDPQEHEQDFDVEEQMAAAQRDEDSPPFEI